MQPKCLALQKFKAEPLKALPYLESGGNRFAEVCVYLGFGSEAVGDAFVVQFAVDYESAVRFDGRSCSVFILTGAALNEAQFPGARSAVGGRVEFNADPVTIQNHRSRDFFSPLYRGIIMICCQSVL